MSPDHATQATKSPLSRLRRYSLPVKARICPSAVAREMTSSASNDPSSSTTFGSYPRASIVRPRVSRISESIATRPRNSGSSRSLMLRISRPVSAGS
jgi:hypothetical protein